MDTSDDETLDDSLPCDGLPTELQKLYEQVVSARTQGLDLLVLAGVRMLIEGICDNKRIPRKTASGQPLSLRERVALLKPSPPPWTDEQSYLDEISDVIAFTNVAIHKRACISSSEVARSVELAQELLTLCLPWEEA